MFVYFNVVEKDGKRIYEERFKLRDLSEIKTLNDLKNEMKNMSERQKDYYSNMFFNRFSQLGGNR